jgi:hypothetical protein
MSLHNQLVRGLYALPFAALLIVAGVVAPVEGRAQADDCRTVQADVPTPRSVDFHSMLPGAIHVVKVVRLTEG